MTGSTSLADYVSQQYMPWIKENKAPSTVRGSIQIWAAYIEPRFGKISLVDLRTEKITELLDSMAKQGFGTRTLSHTKWLLSGVYEYAINRGVVHNNPVTKAKWLVKAKRPKAKIEYSLTQVLDMLRVLEPVDLRTGRSCFVPFHVMPTKRSARPALGRLARRATRHQTRGVAHSCGRYQNGRLSGYCAGD